MGGAIVQGLDRARIERVKRSRLVDVGRSAGRPNERLIESYS
jgi:hypothetical protein